ncbi:GlxA family transcriptional regulator [Streptomyces sp. NPDC014894]|uniref:GlxA family transcriptional regulator n=1 Tax=Streptomyces sp. NPDC014894 TaxID=3364931 RepID=UPI0036F78B22
MATTLRHVVIIGYDRAELLDIACVADTFDIATRTGAASGYRVTLATPDGRPVTCSSGLVLAGQTSLEKIRGPVDTVVVSGGLGHGAAARDARLVEQVRRIAALSRRVASVCTGASVLAAAGLLDGRRATTHWAFARDLAAEHPAVEVDPGPLYIRDGAVCTSAGVTSALDLTLALVEEDHGPELARSVARTLVTHAQRPGDQAQISAFVDDSPPRHGAVHHLVRHIAGHLADDLGTEALAALASVSERHLNRLFTDHLGRTPAQYVREARAEAAERLLVTTELPLPAVAVHCGFRSTETLRQAFLAHYGTTPSSHRAAHRRRTARADGGAGGRT